MKKWKEYSSSERGMAITIGILILAICLNFGRVRDGFKKGMNFFFTPPASEQKQ